MPNPKLADSLGNLGRALERLREGLESPEPPPLVVDGTIQRFEFVVELFWKTLTSHVYDEGLARAIYLRVRTYWPEFQRCHAFLSERFGAR